MLSLITSCNVGGLAKSGELTTWSNVHCGVAFSYPSAFVEAPASVPGIPQQPCMLQFSRAVGSQAANSSAAADAAFVVCLSATEYLQAVATHPAERRQSQTISGRATIEIVGDPEKGEFAMTIIYVPLAGQGGLEIVMASAMRETYEPLVLCIAATLSSASRT